MMDTRKQYAGNHPDLESGWIRWFEIQSNDGVSWSVYFKNQEHSDEWVTYKVCANGKASGKANFWFTKNTQTGQVGFGRDRELLKEHRPEIFERLESAIKEEIEI